MVQSVILHAIFLLVFSAILASFVLLISCYMGSVATQLQRFRISSELSAYKALWFMCQQLIKIYTLAVYSEFITFKIMYSNLHFQSCLYFILHFESCLHFILTL